MQHEVERTLGKTKVKLLFKSGNIELLEVDGMKIKSINDQITGLSWTNAKPKIMFISLADIVAIYEVE